MTFPAQAYPQEQQVQRTYLQIPQVARINAVILSQLEWMWGAEMRANASSVVIGNEVVWTTQSYKITGLLDMG